MTLGVRMREHLEEQIAKLRRELGLVGPQGPVGVVEVEGRVDLDEVHRGVVVGTDDVLSRECSGFCRSRHATLG